MALVRSVEKFSITITAGNASNSASLTKSQDTDLCVPFITSRVTTIASSVNDTTAYQPDVYFSGSTVVAETTTSATREIVVEVTVVEFESYCCTVSQGTFQLTDTTASATPSIGATVREVDSFPYATWRGGTLGDNESSSVSVEFNSTTELLIERFGTSGQIDGHFYVVYAHTREELVSQYAEFDLSGTATSANSLALAANVTWASSIVLGSYSIDGGTDDNEAFAHLRLYDDTGSDKFRMERATTPGTGATTLRCQAYVVEFAGAEVIQRGVETQATETTSDTVTITEVGTLAETMANTPASISWLGMYHPGTAAADHPDAYAALDFTNDTTLRIQHLGNGTQSGDAAISWEVLEWDVSVPANRGDTGRGNITSDDFDNVTLHTDWTEVTPGTTSSSIEGVGTSDARYVLEIPADQDYDWYGGTNTAMRVEQIPTGVDTQFSIEAKFDTWPDPSENAQLCGIAARQSDPVDGQLLLEVWGNGTVLKVVLIDGGTAHGEVTMSTPTTSLRLRLTFIPEWGGVDLDRMTAYYNVDDAGWTELTFRTGVAKTIYSVGAFAGRVSPAAAWDCKLDYFWEGTAAMLTNEDAGAPTTRRIFIC